MDKPSDSVRSETRTSLTALLQEPLTLISIAIFILSFVRLLLTAETWYIAPIISAILGVLSVYFTYLYLKNKEKKYELLGIPVLAFVVTLFFYYTGAYTTTAPIIGRDYAVFSISASLFLLAYTLAVHRVASFDTAMALALFSSTLVIHMVTAYSPYLGHLDPYFNYKIADVTYRSGFIPDHDYMVYPMLRGIAGNKPELEPGLDYGKSSYFSAMYMAYSATANKIFGLTLYDAATLYPAIFSAFTILAVYLVTSELFSESAPYNRIAAFIAAFMMMLSPAYASNSTAINCEDDAFGMLLMVTSALFFVVAYRRRDLNYVFLAGISFFMLRAGWGGYVYVLIILGLFSVFYSITRFVRNEPCFDHVTYMLASVLPSVFTPIILHHRGVLPVLSDFPPYNADIVALSAAIFVGILLEYLRSLRHSERVSLPSPENALDRVNAWIEQRTSVVLALVVVLAIIGLASFGFDEIYHVFKATWESRTQDDVIKKTIAEQHPFAGSLGEYFAVGPTKFGIVFLYAFIMTPVLLYAGFSKGNFGSLFVLAWGLPMLYGLYFKSQYVFTASAPIIILGSTVGLYSIARKKDFETLRVVGFMLVFAIPFVTVPFYGVKNFTEFIAYVPMHMGPMEDRYYWEPALAWLRENTRPNEAVLTWWDYGHWITSEARRPVLIDNLQADPWQIQDVARFFVNKTTEEDAVETFNAYRNKYREVKNISPEGVDLRYVMIDWPMIGKGSALHFIATGNIDTKESGSFENYVICGFYPQASDSTQRVMTDEAGNMFLGRRIVFACGGYIPGVEFLVKEDNELVGVNVILSYGQKVPWKTWVEHNDASLLGVEPLYQVLSLAITRPGDSILPQYRTVIYVPGEFSDFMMTRLYLSDHINSVYDESACALPENNKNLGCVSYLNAELYNREYKPLKNFRLVKDFSNGFVRLYEKVDAETTSPP
jgi:dolichyl-diphosphooligosaccharide--protein glycosyltransferase